MKTPIFEIKEDDGTVELSAFGELTVSSESIFRSHLLLLLKHGKSKLYKLNLKHASAMDVSGMQLIYILQRELNAVDASLTVEMPEEPELRTFLIATGFAERIR
jgi:anti-anti-sigma regulatory factor